MELKKGTFGHLDDGLFANGLQCERMIWQII